MNRAHDMRGKTCGLFLWLVYLYFTGLFYFYKGFLLTKHELHTISDCSGIIPCVFPPSYEKIIILVIDALRHDFLVHKPNNSDEVPYYVNNMLFTNDLLNAGSTQAHLFKFLADPPTTTLQRLKALATGSLPTFIDASSNFGGESLAEDNWICQMARHNKSVIFMGDDTWLSLFPNQFKRSYPYSSFDVWDLDTVDNGVRDNLQHELFTKDWKVLIAHCLGVDHCGHRYGPNHPEMRRKLIEMDNLIKFMIGNMDNDTLLLVMGDHGMTETGDHGGDSLDEISAALFVYSPVPFSSALLPTRSSVSQIDLVPTLALLLGIPIPYSNVGQPILQLLRSPEPGFRPATALYITVQQVWRYLEAYAQQAQPFDVRQYESVFHLYQSISDRWTRDQTPESFEMLITLMEDFLREAKNMCTQVWVHFDLFSIALGLAHLFLAVICNSLAISHFSGLSPLRTPTIHFLIVVVISWTLLALSATHLWPVNWGIQLLFTLVGLAFFRRTLQVLCSDNPTLVPLGRAWPLERPLTTVIWCLLVASSATFFSNSLVVQEPYVAHYLLQSLLWLWVALTPRASRSVSGMTRITLASLFARISLPYFRCREEQLPNCVPHNAHRTLSALHASEWIWVRYACACALCLIVVACLRRLTTTWKYLAALISLVMLHWTLEFFLSSSQQQSTMNLVWVPQLFYALWALGVIHCCVTVMFTAHWSRHVDLLALSTLMALLLAGDGLTWPILALPLVGALALSVCSPSPTMKLNANLPSAFLTLLAVHGFFSTGHHTNFASIPWEVAFVGRRHGNDSNSLFPVVMVLFSTFFAYIFCALALPLSFLWQARKNNLSRKETIQAVCRAVLHYLLYHGIRLTCASLAAVFLRRHLMVWKIFAPRWIYEGIAFLITVLFITTGWGVALCTLRSPRTGLVHAKETLK